MTFEMTANRAENLAETLARELKNPVDMTQAADQDDPITRIALPPGWTLVERDDSARERVPFRKIANVALGDADSFIDYAIRHKELTSTVWCVADYKNGKVSFTAILNDHGDDCSTAEWRDHRAEFTPEFSTEWSNWTATNKNSFSQVQFAEFIENNLRDFSAAEGAPTGAQMLEMALSFEANQDMRYKSAIRLQSGGVQMSFTQDDDNQTVQQMKMFDRFSLGIPVFWNADAYRLDARLRYRVREGKLTFWYELIRPEKVLEAATKTLIEHIRAKTELPFFFGRP